jgi:hypothetical protein
LEQIVVCLPHDGIGCTATPRTALDLIHFPSARHSLIWNISLRRRVEMKSIAIVACGSLYAEGVQKIQLMCSFVGMILVEFK